MSTLVFMKVLESAPSRYDRGIKFLTLGKIPALYEEITAPLSSEHQVLDIGCGTGLITLLAAHQGASVKGVDINPETLYIAKKRYEKMTPPGKVEFVEMGIAELDKEPDNSYDYIYAGLVFSELENYEQDFALRQISRLLKSGGRFVLIDEVTPQNPLMRVIRAILRLPLVVITYLLTQTTTSSVENIEERLQLHGLAIEKQDHFLLCSLTVIRCRRTD